MLFVIEDQVHADWHGQFNALQDAVDELKRRATVPWDKAPNVAPCTTWRTCGREYVVIEFDDSRSPWVELRRFPILQVSAAGIKWTSDVESGDRGSGPQLDVR